MNIAMPGDDGPPAYVPTLTEVVPDPSGASGFAVQAPAAHAPAAAQAPAVESLHEQVSPAWALELEGRLADALVRALGSSPQAAGLDRQRLLETSHACLDRALDEALQALGRGRPAD